MAQQVPRQLPGTVEPGRDRLQLPLPPDNNFDFSILAPGRSPVPRSVDELRFVVQDIRIIGNVKIPTSAFQGSIDALRGHEATLRDITALADEIEARYRAAGFALARAFVPPQRVSDGIFTINVVEGFVSAVAVEGGDAAQRAQAEAYLAPVLASKPLELSTLERSLLLTNDLPGIAASGLLRPAPTVPGASDLAVTLAPTPLVGDIDIDNRGSKFAGPWLLRSDLAANSLLGTDEQFLASVLLALPDATERVAASLRYTRPLFANGMTVGLAASGTYGNPGSTLAPINLLTNSYAVGPRIGYPILRARQQTLLLDAGITVQDAEVDALGAPFSHDRWRVADASLIYRETGFLAGSSVLTLTAAQGLPFLGASHSGAPELSRPGAHTDFTKLAATLRRNQSIAGTVSAAITVSGQYAFVPLLTGEQIAFGGDSIGRGYDPAVLLGDRGIGAAFELRYDHALEGTVLTLLQPYLFFDGAKVANITGTGLSAGAELSSAGIGVRATMFHGVSAGLEYAKTLSRLATNDDGRLTSRILFNAGVQF